jgi:hypothetical protein
MLASRQYFNSCGEGYTVSTNRIYPAHCARIRSMRGDIFGGINTVFNTLILLNFMCKLCINCVS